MKILVTGATGRVGRAICVKLMREHRVVGFDRAPSSTAHVVADLHDDAALESALEGVDAIVHAAGLHAPHVGVLPDAQFAHVNVDGTRSLLEAARRAGIRRFVFTSTTALYGLSAAPGEPVPWITEATLPRPRTIYHRTKLAAEQLVLDAAERHGMTVRILRMSRCFPEAAPLMALFRLYRGVDARDVALAHALALHDAGEEPATYVVSGVPPFEPRHAGRLSVDLADVLRETCPRLIESFTCRGWATPAGIDRVYDPARTRERLGWQPRHGFDEVLAMLDQESSEVLPPTRP